MIFISAAQASGVGSLFLACPCLEASGLGASAFGTSALGASSHLVAPGLLDL